MSDNKTYLNTILNGPYLDPKSGLLWPLGKPACLVFWPLDKYMSISISKSRSRRNE